MLKILSRPVFTTNQFNRLSNIFDNAGQVVLGVAVIAPIISGFKFSNLPVVLSGIIVISLCWAASIWFASQGEV